MDAVSIGRRNAAVQNLRTAPWLTRRAPAGLIYRSRAGADKAPAVVWPWSVRQRRAARDPYSASVASPADGRLISRWTAYATAASEITIKTTVSQLETK